MDFRDHIPHLRRGKDVLTYKAYTKRLVGRLVNLFCSGRILSHASSEAAETLIEAAARYCRRYNVEHIRKQWLRKAPLLPDAPSDFECVGAQYDLTVFVHVQHCYWQDLCSLLD